MRTMGGSQRMGQLGLDCRLRMLIRETDQLDGLTWHIMSRLIYGRFVRGYGGDRWDDNVHHGDAF